jgi:type III pantothenate kinase
MNYLNKYEWIGLAIGNSRWHWAWFQGESLQKAWDSEPIITDLIDQKILKENLSFLTSDRLANLPIYVASVVPSQTILWQTYPQANLINLDNIPLQNLYPTLGIDRALTLLGAGMSLGFPCLVIDAGTALTFTGANRDRILIGGAILPGLKLQFQSLATKTAALPKIQLPKNLPNRFAIATPEAIQSGIIYVILAGIHNFITDWLERFPNSNIALTGGDGQLLYSYLKIQFPDLVEQIIIDPYLIFWGMRSVISNQ